MALRDRVVSTKTRSCRSCKIPLPATNLLSLGDQHIVDFLETGKKSRGKSPLELVQCDSCQLLQLRHTVDPDLLFKKFFYRSGINESMRAALLDVVECASQIVHLTPTSWVLDIGSNDGTLLSFYPYECRKIGFEPAVELATESMAKSDAGTTIMPEYFNGRMFLDAFGHSRKFQIITAIAMFYDLEDPLSFLRDVAGVMDQHGIFVVQMNYLASMLRNVAFDNIGHEHLCYYSLTTLKPLLDLAGLSIFRVENNSVNGGSFRVYACHPGTQSIEESVVATLKYESEYLGSSSAIPSFTKRIKEVCSSLREFIYKLDKAGKQVWVYGASTRGSTLMQSMFSAAESKAIFKGMAERDTTKFGRTMPGIDVPIMSETAARAKAEYMLVLPWHFWDVISRRELDWMKKGGKFILPLPYPKVVEWQDIGLVSNDLIQAGRVLTTEKVSAD